jgi:hypothetical protein
MASIRSKRIVLVLAIAALSGFYGTSFVPIDEAVVVAQGGGRGGRGGLPGATAEQTQAVADMNTALAPLTTAVTAARTALATATYADVRNAAAIAEAVEKLRAAELALAMGRAAEFSKLQAGPRKLSAEQVSALVAAGGTIAPARGGGARPGGPAGGGPAGGARATGAPPSGRGN